MKEFKPIVLFVDDNQDMREYIGRLLSHKFRLAFAKDGLQGLETLKTVICLFILKQPLQTTPDLILSDVMMPNMDGIQFVQHLKDDSLLSKIPVVFISARAGEEAKLDGLSHGVDYLTKPFSAKELIAKVTNHILASFEARKQRQIQAEREKQYQRHFLAVLSHELRTPLTPVLLLAESLEKDTHFPDVYK